LKSRIREYPKQVGMQLMERDISVWDVYWRLRRKSNPP